MDDEPAPGWSSPTPNPPSARAVGPLGQNHRGADGDPGRRPLDERERVAAQALGSMLLEQRRERGLRQADVAARAGLAPRSLRRLERGERRTRRSTLERIARALDPHAGADLVVDMVRLAGPALAEESAYSDRVERRRRRRTAAASERFLTEVVVLRETTAGGVLETVTVRRRIGRQRIVETVRGPMLVQQD